MRSISAILSHVHGYAELEQGDPGDPLRLSGLGWLPSWVSNWLVPKILLNE